MSQDLGVWRTSLESVVRPDSFLGAVLYLLVFALIAAILGRWLRVAVNTLLARYPEGHIDRTAAQFLRQLGVLLIWAFTLATYAHLVPSLRAIGTALLTGASVASIVLGLAAQNTLGNLIAGISLLIYRPFRIGDVLQVNTPAGPETGIVESVSLGYTSLRTMDGRCAVIPNSLAASQTSLNLNAVRAVDRGSVITLIVWLARSADVERTRVLAVAIAEAHGATQRVLGCWVTKTEPGATQLSLILRSSDGETAVRLSGALIDALKQAMDREGIPVPDGKQIARGT
jgi:small-conductance mechanosensitive channel